MLRLATFRARWSFSISDSRCLGLLADFFLGGPAAFVAILQRADSSGVVNRKIGGDLDLTRLRWHPTPVLPPQPAATGPCQVWSWDITVKSPCITVTRITVGEILEVLATGESVSEIIERFPAVIEDSARAAILFPTDRENNSKILISA